MAEGPKVPPVGEVMSSPVVTAEPSETVAEASTRMDDHKVGSLVVVDGARPIGILTERDLVRFAAASGDASATKVSEWMTEDPDTVGPDLPVTEAYASLASHGYRHIPVVDDGALVGVVSLRDLMRISSIQPVVHPGEIEAPKGLAGVIVAETEVGDVRGQEGFYHYRQYSATDLAEKRSLEAVWHLLFEGSLPTAAEAAAFRDEVVPLRAVAPTVMANLPAIAAAGKGGPLDDLRTAVSLVGQAAGMRPSLDISAEQLRADALRVCAVVPTLVMALHRLANGQEPIQPRDDLGYAANYLYMLTGEEPSPEHARAVEQYLITTPPPSPPGSSPRRAPTWLPPSWAASAPSPARCTAAPPAGLWT